ncbi:unnamed protein product [Angiostrongylus costaricensis]|uniref:BPI2 domain-containing protein n=1 Tax=Angiostrongylus costaricensis TaxID=334426 RepID=A0A158PJJ4_ANGCS|nr:unnamed protein product [Angiostrongylus costaricensis]
MKLLQIGTYSSRLENNQFLQVPGAPLPRFVPPPSALCARCPGSGGADDPSAFLRQLAAGLDLLFWNFLSGTPFGAFPVSFPSAYDNHMIELIVSDYTINTLFYQLHRKQFLTFQIGPDTPKIGELLKTTCSEDEDEGLEGTEVELDENEESRRLKNALRKLKKLRTRRSTKERGKRQDDAGGLADLGICFGDILPAVREKYPNQRISIVIRTVRAPSVILSQAQGGTVILDLVADADLYILNTNRVGTMTIATTVVIVAQLRGNQFYGTAMITNLKLTDRAGTLGLPQDALDNLGNLGKELVQKMLSDTLQKGVQINIPTGSVAGLPINIINPSMRIIEHGLYIATDITISPSLFGISGGQQC